jgi:hypothetical protein
MNNLASKKKYFKVFALGVFPYNHSNNIFVILQFSLLVIFNYLFHQHYFQ